MVSAKSARSPRLSRSYERRPATPATRRPSFLRQWRSTPPRCRAPSRIAALISHDADFVALVEPEHRADEIRPERAIDPGGAQNDAVLATLSDRLFAAAWSARKRLWARWIVFPIGAVERAVEDVVGRKMHEWNAEPRRGSATCPAPSPLTRTASASSASALSTAV